MVQVWEIKNNIFTGNSYFVEKVLENHVIVPLLVGYIKPLWTGTEWTEGATAEEIAEWKEQNKIDICEKDRPKTNEELTEEQIKMQKFIADLEIDILNKG